MAIEKEQKNENKYVLYFVPERGTSWAKKDSINLCLSPEEEKVYVHPIGHRWAGTNFIPPQYKIILYGGDGVIIDETTKNNLVRNWPGKYGGNVVGGDDNDPKNYKAFRIDVANKEHQSMNKGHVIKGYFEMPLNWDVPAKQEGSHKIPRN